jgi:hypothetical protein
MDAGFQADTANPVVAPRRFWRTALLVFVLIAAIGMVYWPALWHAPHSDQLVYYVDTLGHESFFDLIRHTYSYNRTRLIQVGDTQLFRPMFFVWQAGLKAFAGAYLEVCQGVGIALHMLVCVLLFLLLRRIFRDAAPSEIESDGRAQVAPLAVSHCKPDDAGGAKPQASSADSVSPPLTMLPFALAFFFALNYAIVEQVIWYNIQPYLVAIALILASVLLLLKATDSAARHPGWSLASAWTLTLWAAFTYELGQFFAICAGLVLFSLPWADWRRRCLAGFAFLAIAASYQGVNCYDHWYHTGTYTDDVALTQLATRACDTATVEHVTRYALYTTVQPFLPCRISAFGHGKIRIAEELWYTGLPWRPSLVLAWAVVGLWLGLIVLGICRLRTRRALTLTLLLAGTAAAQAAMIVLGRMNMRIGSTTLCFNSHYSYMGLVFALALSGVALAHAQQWRGRLGYWLANGSAGFLVLGLVFLGLGSGYKVYRLNARIAHDCRSYWVSLPSLRAYIRAHRHEPNFRYALGWNRDELMPHSFEMPAPLLFYRRYADSEHPTHVLWYENQTFTGMPIESWRRAHPDGTPPLCGDFVQLGRKYSVFYRNGFFYAINLGDVRPFLSSPHPERDEFYRDRDVAKVLEWISANKN